MAKCSFDKTHFRLNIMVVESLLIGVSPESPQFLLRIDEATGENSTQVDDDDDDDVNGQLEIFTRPSIGP